MSNGMKLKRAERQD